MSDIEIVVMQYWGAGWTIGDIAWDLRLMEDDVFAIIEAHEDMGPY